MIKHLFCILLNLFVFLSLSFTQDIRVSQFNNIPLIINPANTGHFDGNSYRVIGLYANFNNDSITNVFRNISIDKNIGKKKNWAFGFNYLNSGFNKFPMSGNYWGFSVAKKIILDKNNLQQLRLGFQASYLKGEYDARKGSYNRYLDASVVKYHDDYVYDKFVNSIDYMNYSAGFIYSINLPNVYFETGISAYNITNPRNWDLIPQSGYRKRFRMSIKTSLKYMLSENKFLQFDHLSWKEGLYLRVFRPNMDDGTEITENTFGLSFTKASIKKSYYAGLFTREWKSAYSILSYNFNPNIGISFSYELPLNKIYYDISHFEISFQYLINRKRNKFINKLIPFVDINSNKKLNYRFNNYNLFISTQTYKNFKNNCFDRDNDGVLDYVDNCPDEFGSLYNAGCPISESTISKDVTLISNNKSPNNDIKNIYFNYNDFNLNTNGLIVADKLVSYLQNNNKSIVSLLGLTSIEGTLHYNMELSKKRVITIASYLQSFGIHQSRVLTSFAGNKYATICNGDRDKKWPDRKVAVRIFENNSANSSNFSQK